MRFSGIALSDYSPEYEQEREPTIERGKDISRFWWRVLIAVIIAGVLIGFFASVSYVKYPYEVSVRGTWFSSNGGELVEVALPACDAFIYTQCPDPGMQPTIGCEAPPDMNMPILCITYEINAPLGHYTLTLRNGEDYAVTGALSYPNGTFDKNCVETIALVPQTSQRNVTENFNC